MREGLSRVREAILSRQPADAWREAHELISTQRASVDRYLATTGRPRVYGFDTLLGPLDSEKIPDDAQLMLLDAHLQGRQGRLDRETFTAMTAVKLEQLSLGGTGIHPDSFNGILNSIALEEPAYSGAWRDSYSSGDVVPAAWWLKNIRDRGYLPRLHAGDVISLINGNFVSTATGVIALESLGRYFAEFLAVSAAVVDPPAEHYGRSATRPLVEAIWDRRYTRPSPDSVVQKPVSVRDGQLYVGVITAALNQMAEALSERLSTSSGNPLFAAGPDGGLRSLSQVSFLGFNLTQASTSAMQALSLCMGALHRFTQQKSDLIQSGSPEPLQYAVQPPKVSRAILEGARLRFGNLPLSFTGVESGGVEDVWDLSLPTTGMLADFLIEAKSQFVPLRDLNGGSDTVAAAHVDKIHQELLKVVL